MESVAQYGQSTNVETLFGATAAEFRLLLGRPVEQKRLGLRDIVSVFGGFSSFIDNFVLCSISSPNNKSMFVLLYFRGEGSRSLVGERERKGILF